MRHSAYEVETLLLFTSSSLSGKCISLISRKPAGKIRTGSRLIGTDHRDLVAIVQLRHAARRQHKKVREFQAGDRRSPLAHEAAVVMTAQKCDQNIRVRVEVVFRQSLGHFVEVSAFSESVANRIEQGKIQQRVEA